MSSNQIPHQEQSQSPQTNEIPSKHNITLGPEQSERKSLPHSNFMPNFSENYAIQFQLKNISREVERLAEKGRFLGQSLPLGASSHPYQTSYHTNQLEKDLSDMLNLKTNSSTLSKYNYYGRQYRFSTQNPSQNSQKPMDLNPSYPIQDQELKSFSPTTKYKPKKQDKSQELNVPDSKSYFIYFDQPKREKQLNFQVNKIESSHQMTENLPEKKKGPPLYSSVNFGKALHHSNFENEDDEARTPPLQVFSKQEPESKWVLEKKVKKLEKELNMMKRKEEQRQRLRNFTSNNSKKDSKVFVGKQVDQLINSLWP